MKFLITFFAVIGVTFAQFAPYYKPTYARSGALEKYARTLRNEYDLSPDGTYQYAFETDNGIAAEQSGFPVQISNVPPVVAEQVTGRFSWTSPEGKFISIAYVADENGYRPIGDILPNNQFSSEPIQRKIEFNKLRAAQRLRASN